MANKQYKFQFLKYSIRKASIEIKAIDEINQSLDISFKKSDVLDSDDSGLYKLELIVAIEDSSKNLRIDIEAIGYFKFDENLKDEDKESFFNINAPAILFPYLRAYISTLTALSGINPIILPTINLSGGAIKEKRTKGK